jgi:hypothetical protein
MQSLAELLDPTIKTRGYVLPLAMTESGRYVPAIPGSLVEILLSFDKAGRMATGEAPLDAGSVADAALGAGLLGSPIGFAASPRGSLGSFGGKAGPYIPNTPPKDLRDRYWGVLYEASGGKDPRKIKLTEDRLGKAKTLLAAQFSNRNDVLGNSVETPQSRKALAFASEAMRGGIDDVRVKYPDGPFGSVYVRVGDKGTARFSDHPQPLGWTGNEYGPVGGFSKTIGRRHRPAAISVAPGDSPYDDALAWLNKMVSGK